MLSQVSYFVRFGVGVIEMELVVAADLLLELLLLVLLISSVGIELCALLFAFGKLN
jgi:hypothetical protein